MDSTRYPHRIKCPRCGLPMRAETTSLVWAQITGDISPSNMG